MAPFVHHLDITDEHQIVEHFRNVPDITEHILETDIYPLDALSQALNTLYKAVEKGDIRTEDSAEYRRTILKIESVISTRIDYVTSFIETLLEKESFDPQHEPLDDSSTQEILSHIDLMKDVAYVAEINREEYETALRKFLKILKFRFNKGLEIHKQLYHYEFEDIAQRRDEYPESLLDEYKNYLDDALAMTRNHVPVKPIQIYQLKETLFKILEARALRVLQAKRFHSREEYAAILHEIETLLLGLELDVGQKLVKRFSAVIPEYIADHLNFNVIKHNRKFVELVIDYTDDAIILEDLYKILSNLVTAEATQLQRKRELSKPVSLQDIQELDYVKNEENALIGQMDRFKNLEVTEQARELIKISVYGLCEYISKLTVEEFSKYPVGIIKSAEKMLRDLEQHRLKQSEIQSIQNVTEYSKALHVIEESLNAYDSYPEKYNFVDIYKESDCMVDTVTFCMFNDIILRVIQNIMEAYFAVDSDNGKVSSHRLSELQITIAERYKTEWLRQNNLRQQSEQEAMEELADALA